MPGIPRRQIVVALAALMVGGCQQNPATTAQAPFAVSAATIGYAPAAAGIAKPYQHARFR